MRYFKKELQSLILKKRFVVLLFALVLFMPSFSYDFEVDGIYYNKTGSNTVGVTYKSDYDSGYSGDIIIPEQVDFNGTTYSITSIGGCAFSYCSGLTSITIPNSVTTIDDETFFDCSGLSSVVIPNSVTSIGRSAFYRCTNLTSVIIGESVTSIGETTFYECHRLASVTIPNSVTSIGSHAFYRCI